MIITISGNLGSGKSTVAKALARKLKYKHYSTGDFWRTLAARRQLDVYEYNKLAENNPNIDREIDSYSGELGKKKDNFVIDSRLAWHFIPHSFKVRLTVEPREGAKRIYQHGLTKTRGNERQYQTVNEAVTASKQRERSENKRYLGLYQTDVTNKLNYDLVIDTTKISPEQVVEKIINNLPNK